MESQKKKRKRKAGVAFLLSNKTDFKPAKIKKTRALHNGKGIIATRRAILNIYIYLGYIYICTPNTGAPRFIKQVFRDLQRDLDSHNNGGKL